MENKKINYFDNQTLFGMFSWIILMFISLMGANYNDIIGFPSINLIL